MSERGERTSGEEMKEKESVEEGNRADERRGTKNEGGEMRKGEMEMVPGREGEQVDEDATGWVEVRRRTRRRVAEGEREDERGERCKMVQIFVKMDGSRTIVMDVSQNDEVSDMMKRIPSGDDVYVTSGGRVLRGCDKLRSCGVRDRSTVQVVSRSRTRRAKVRRNRPRTHRSRNLRRDSRRRGARRSRRATKVQRLRGSTGSQ